MKKLRQLARFLKLTKDPVLLRQTLRHRYQISKSIDEVKLVCDIFQSQLEGKLAIDIGFHRGESSQSFLRSSQKVLAFEPNEELSATAPAQVLEDSRLVLCNCAISDEEGEREFYLSDVSTGVSSLLELDDIHNRTLRVQTRLLASVLEENNTENLDISVLKIDVEGHEISILKSMDFDKIRPEIVIAEFEDRKTERGNLRSLLQVLIEKGYKVVISAWQPIIRYGIQHEWDCFIDIEDTVHANMVASLLTARWGNVIAFSSNVTKSEFLKKAPF